MSRTSVLSDEEKRQRRNEASRRCYLKRKAAMEAAGQLTPKGAKNKVRTNSTPVSKTSNISRIVEKLTKKFTKPVSSIKPMLREAATILNEVYKTCDEKTANKLEKQLCSGLNLKIVIDAEAKKTYLSFTQQSKSIKTPSYKIEVAENTDVIEENVDDTISSDIDNMKNSREISVDPSILEDADIESSKFTDKVMSNFNDDDINDPFDDEEDDYIDDEDNDPDEEDEEDEEDDDEDDEKPVRRRRKHSDYGSVRDYEEMGRWDMMGEMEAQGSFDDY